MFLLWAWIKNNTDIISSHDWCPTVLHLAALKTYYEEYWRHVALRLSLVKSIKFSLQLLTTLFESVLILTTTALFPFLILQENHQQWQDGELSNKPGGEASILRKGKCLSSSTEAAVGCSSFAFTGQHNLALGMHVSLCGICKWISVAKT